MRYIVTTGQQFTDIDGYACCIAYADMMRKMGKSAVAVLPGPLNETVIPQVRTWPVGYETVYQPQEDDQFVVLDISQKEYFASFVNLEKVIEVYDHHFGYEEEWQQRIGGNAKIEKMGACATLIVEKAREYGVLENLEATSKKLLYTAIFANSLNLKASVTTERDIVALRSLGPMVDFPNNWGEEYFVTLQQEVVKDPIDAMQRDHKNQVINGRQWTIWQLELWDAGEFVANNKKLLEDYAMQTQEDYSFINIPSIKDGKTYVIAKNEDSKKILEQLGAKDGELGKLRLRKEWIKLLQDS